MVEQVLQAFVNWEQDDWAELCCHGVVGTPSSEHQCLAWGPGGLACHRPAGAVCS